MKKLTNEKIDQINRKTTGILIMVIGLILIFAVALLAKFADLAVIREKLNLTSSITKYSITIKGQTSCLPLKESETSSGSCELGLKSEDGKYYAINGSNSPLDLYSEAGSPTVEITGELIEAGPDEKYNIVGTIIQK